MTTSPCPVCRTLVLAVVDQVGVPMFLRAAPIGDDDTVHDGVVALPNAVAKPLTRKVAYRELAAGTVLYEPHSCPRQAPRYALRTRRRRAA